VEGHGRWLEFIREYLKASAHRRAGMISLDATWRQAACELLDGMGEVGSADSAPPLARW